jgi:RimJ/RimL family protein N-acetyltransferase
MISRTILRREDFRFELRPYELSFASGIFQAALESRKEISPWMAWLHADYNLEDAKKWAAYCIDIWTSKPEYEFVIFDRQDGMPVGSGGLNGINPKDMFCNLGYWVRTSKTRLGAATQAALLLKDFGFDVLKLHRLEIVVANGNTASRRVAEKAGAVYEGLLRRRVTVGDKVHDGHMYAFV